MKAISKLLFIILGFSFVGLGWLGVLVPGLPTVPFMILALACFAKSSERFYAWLYNHKIFGKQIRLWQKYQVIPLYAKIIAITSMVLSMVYIIFWTNTNIFIILFIASIMIFGIIYISSKPNNPPKN